MGYTKDTIKGVSWIGLLRMSTRGVSFLRTLILARLLSPAQFGIFGIAILVTAFLEILTETGINVILIQEKEDIKKYINSAWIVSIIRGFLIGLIIFLSASFIANFFNSLPSEILIQLISLVPLIRGFINPFSIKFQKHLEFHKEFWYRLVIFSFDAVIATLFAYITQNAISLVFGLIAGALLEVLLSFLVIKPLPNLSFNKNYLLKLFHSGRWITAYGIFNYLGENFDNLVVGKLLGAFPLGIYQMAYKISYIPISEISDVVNKVIFPVFAKIEVNREKLVNAFKKTTLIVSALAIPTGVFIFVFSKEIVILLLGDRWVEVGPILKILSFYGVIRAIYGPSTALFLSLKKQKYITVMTSVRLFGLFITIVPFVSRYGMLGAAYSALFSSAIEIPVVIYFIFLILKENTKIK